MASRLHYRKRAKPGVLTPAQLQCAKLASMGLMQKEIAIELKVTQKTVNRHIDCANKKLGTHSPLEVARSLLLLGHMKLEDFLQPDIESWRENRRTSYP